MTKTCNKCVHYHYKRCHVWDERVHHLDCCGDYLNWDYEEKTPDVCEQINRTAKNGRGLGVS